MEDDRRATRGNVEDAEKIPRESALACMELVEVSGPMNSVKPESRSGRFD